MLLPSSRYYRQKTEEVTAKDGRRVRALSLRRLPDLSGKPTVVKGHDRLDVMAQRQYGDATMFWRIADANTELEANRLTRPIGRSIAVPEE